MTDITIPPEVVEAAARAAFVYYKALPWDECTDKPLWQTLARAAIIAAIKAWPGAYRTDSALFSPALIIPLTQETDA